jgi:repressor LexA
MKVLINANEKVKVKLTEIGLKELERQHDKLRKAVSSAGPWEPPTVDEEGYSEFQLWVLMNKLGHLCQNGFGQPFATELVFERPL